MKATEFLISSMLEDLRMILQKWFYNRRNKAEYQVTKFTKSTRKQIRKQIEKG